MNISDLKSASRSFLLWYTPEKGLFAVMVGGALVTLAILYIFSSPGNQTRPEFTGRIVEKRVSVYESREGSSFVNDLVIEDKSGRRFRFSVTDEIYGRAKVGMWIKKSANKVELLTDAEHNGASP